MAEIVFDNVTKIFRSDVIGLENVSFEVEQGEFIFVIGKSGAGKSTLIKLLSGQIACTKGDIQVRGCSINSLKKNQLPYFRRKFGIMSGEFGLLKDRSVYENVSIALCAIEHPKLLIDSNVKKALSIVGLKNKSGFYPHEISIGEAARVCLARALVTNPKIIVADEPTANLDSGLAWDIMCLLDEINRMGITVIVASHARELVTVMRKRVLTLVAGSLIADEKRAIYNSGALDIFEYRKVMEKRNRVDAAKNKL